jgi:hypothetical protein
MSLVIAMHCTLKGDRSIDFLASRGDLKKAIPVQRNHFTGIVQTTISFKPGDTELGVNERSLG